MWCRTVRKLIYDYVDGLVEGRTSGHIRTHLDRCVKCAAAEDDARYLTNSLASWEDLPEPEDGWHRLETRLAFVPQLPATFQPRGKLYTLVLPYFAGAASAAAIMLALLPLLRSGPPMPTTPGPSTVVSEEKSAPALLPGEQELTYRDVQSVVDEHGNLIELSPELREALRQRLWPNSLDRRVRFDTPLPSAREINRATPVDFQER